jgi:chloride channel protein, CIC family
MSQFAQPSVNGSRQARESSFRLVTISLLAAVIGIIVGFAAYLLYSLIGLISNLVFFQRVSTQIPVLQSHQLGLLVIIVPVIGGLIVGLMARYGSPKIRGHGIPEAIEAVIANRSRISPKVAILKPTSAAIAIGTGGPFGAEGPIIQTGGAIGSLVGQIIKTTPSERKVLLACGASAGMAAIFSTPIAAVILGIELLLFEFKSRSFIPLVIATTLATTVHFQVLGRSPLFQVGKLDFGIPLGLPFYVVLGLICGVAASGFSKGLYWVEDQFEKLPVHSMWWPALGGLGLGIIGYFVPRILGVGYDTIGDILNNRLPLAILLSLMVFKSVALFISLGSGTSGGLLAPMFMVGAALGGSFALIINQIIPGANLSPGAYALVGMAAMFGSAARATFTLIIFAFEITQDYNAILPLMLVCVIADIVCLFLMQNSIMTEKLARRGLRIQHEYQADMLNMVTVASVMDKDTATVAATMTVAEVIDRINLHDARLTRHQALVILDENNALKGIITRGDLLKAINEGHNDWTVTEAGTEDMIVTYPDTSVRQALNLMLRNDIGRLPVVDVHEPSHLIGYLSRASIMAAHYRHIQEEHEVEAGWVL